MGAQTFRATDLDKFNDSDVYVEVAAKTGILNLKRCNLGEVPQSVEGLKRVQVCDLR